MISTREDEPAVTRMNIDGMPAAEQSRDMKKQSLVTRREALKHLSAGALLALGMWPGAARAGIFGWGNHRDFKFIVVNDLHYMDDECGRWLEGAIRQMKSHGAE